MPIRLLLIEPDQELLESFRTYFSRFTEFDIRYSLGGEDCIPLLRDFRPDVLLMEPALPHGIAVQILESIGTHIDAAVVPVLVLTNRPNWIDGRHSAIKELHVKPQSLRDIADRIRKLAQAPREETT